MTSETLGECILFLAKELEGVILPIYGTFNKTNLSDDPSKKKLLIGHGVKYPKNVQNLSKTNVSLGFAGSAARKILIVSLTTEVVCGKLGKRMVYLSAIITTVQVVVLLWQHCLTV